MAEDGGCCCKCILALLSVVFELGGFAFVGTGVWKTTEKPQTVSGFWIMIVQGALLVTVGTGGLCCVCKKSRSGLKGFCVFLALLALADIVTGMVVHFKCQQGCSDLLPNNSPNTTQLNSTEMASLVMGVFLGTAVLLIVALVWTIVLLKQTGRLSVEINARFSAKL